MTIIKCVRHGELEYAWIDGYWFGDTLLEDMLFRVIPDKLHDGEYMVTIDPEFDDDYWDGLNKDKWLREAKDTVPDIDLLICPKCGDNYDVENPYYQEPTKPPIELKSMSWNDVLNSLLKKTDDKYG